MLTYQVIWILKISTKFYSIKRSSLPTSLAVPFDGFTEEVITLSCVSVYLFFSHSFTFLWEETIYFRHYTPGTESSALK